MSEFEWIRIEERTPDRADEYLTFEADGTIEVAVWFPDRGEWWSCGETRRTPTHWMPLPPPPGTNPEAP